MNIEILKAIVVCIFVASSVSQMIATDYAKQAHSQKIAEIQHERAAVKAAEIAEQKEAYEAELANQKQQVAASPAIISSEPAVSNESTPEAAVEPEAEPSTEEPAKPGRYAGWYQLTAYTHTGNPMANGQMPFVGAVACNSLPIGTVIYIEGYGTYTVCDTGGMGGGVIDIFMNSYDECIQFGRQGADVYIIE